MPITKTCKCGTDSVTKETSLIALKEVFNGCADCKDPVAFTVTSAGKEKGK